MSHGWTVDDQGKKMSKSLGNGIEPQEVTKQYGADILRLLFASCDYHADVKLSHDVLKQLSDSYRKVRNTARFILGNLYDFDPNKDTVPTNQLEELDLWALNRLNEVIETSLAAYDAYEFNDVYRAIHSYCVVDLSNVYLDIVKDRLYVEAPDSATRRAAQTTIYWILSALTRLLTPVLCFTSDEIWKMLPADDKFNGEAVLLNDMPEKVDIAFDDELKAKWNRILDVRSDVMKATENARVEKVIGSNLDAAITLYAHGEVYEFLGNVLEDLPSVLIASEVILKSDGEGAFQGNGFSVDVAKADGQKCERCWHYDKNVGTNAKHPTLCPRCAAILG
ncbi:MAG: class I tRNA ligase family protein [Oscillospiraceae bacterium]|nr:class I tRNA ligase family protein [Oscillospiraceae bacterium]